MSNTFKLNTNDFVKGAVTAVFAGVITVLYSLVSQPDFNVFDANWAVIVNDVIKVSMTTILAYLMKNFISSSDGKVLGEIG